MKSRAGDELLAALGGRSVAFGARGAADRRLSARAARHRGCRVVRGGYLRAAVRPLACRRRCRALACWWARVSDVEAQTSGALSLPRGLPFEGLVYARSGVALAPILVLSLASRGPS